MSYRCQMCNKKSGTGMNVSHSNRHTKRKFRPNLIEKRLFNPETGKKVLAKICAKCLKTYAKLAA